MGHFYEKLIQLFEVNFNFSLSPVDFINSRLLLCSITIIAPVLSLLMLKHESTSNKISKTISFSTSKFKKLNILENFSTGVVGRSNHKKKF